jgi:hypothetical protein
MTVTSAEPGPVRPVVDVRRLAAKWWPLAAAAVLVAVVMVYRQLSAEAPAAPVDPLVLEREAPTTTLAPRLDPLANFTKPLAPVAQALVGPVYEDRAELQRRLNELFGTGLNECGVYIGSDGVSWSISAVWSAGHPSPVFAGCAFPPAVTK